MEENKIRPRLRQQIFHNTCKYFNSEVAASRSEVWAIAQVKDCAEGAK